MDNDASTRDRLEHALADVRRELHDVRAELAAVKADRDRLEKRIASLGEMQTDTIVLNDFDEDATLDDPPLPTLEELMAKLDTIAEGGERHGPSSPSSDRDPSGEMIAPEIVFPEAYEATADAHIATEPQLKPNTRLLVLAGAVPPIKFPLYKKRTTIGRMEVADIPVEGMHVSRVHARIELTADGAIIEDVASKNGIRVNAKTVARSQLRHGDVVSIGKAHFTFIETV